MFEQASLDNRGALKSPWAFAISISGQTLLITAGVLISLVHTEVIPRLPSFTFVSPSMSGPSRPSEQQAPARSATRASRAFTMPVSVPKKTDWSQQEFASAPSIDFNTNGAPVATGFGPGSDLPGLVVGIEPSAPLPHRPEPAPQKKADTIAPRKPVAVSSGVQAAKLVRQVLPAYPPLAKSAHVSGAVRLMAIIGKDGAIQNLQVTAGHPLLTGAAMDAVKQWRYQPTLLNGEPVEVITQIDVNFTLAQ